MNKSYYNENAFRFFKNTVDIDMLDIYNEFTAFLSPGAKILDIGCGSGRDVLYFKKKGYKIIGVDNSQGLVKLARKHTKEQIILKDLMSLDFNDDFDGIWACASLLHIERKKLPDAFERLILYTRKNSIIYASFKYGNFEGIRNGRYFTDLTEEGLYEILKGKKIMIKKIWKTQDKRKDNQQIWLNTLLISD